jgi:two-component system nitrogen regulation response regulator GlnG
MNPRSSSASKERFAQDQIEVLTARSAEDALRLVVDERPDLVLLDIRLATVRGWNSSKHSANSIWRLLIVFITGHGTADTAIEAMKLGAYDYLVKPLDLDLLRQTVSQALTISRWMNIPAFMEETGNRISSRPPGRKWCRHSDGLQQIGRGGASRRQRADLGECMQGVGRARHLPAQPGAKHAPFLALNCAAIPVVRASCLGMNEGIHRRGAPPDRKFEQCNGGTLFLDEIGDMAPATQAKILRVLQERRLERLGGNETIHLDVRILVATNEDLDALIQRGRFRADLLIVLRGVTIRLPPLRQRREDISDTAHYFLFRFNRQLGRAVQSIAPETLELLQQYDWPGTSANCRASSGRP